MRLVNNVKVTAFIRYSEDVPKSKERLQLLFPGIDFAKNKQGIEMREEQIPGDDDAEDMASLTIYTDRQPHIRTFTANLAARLSAQDKATLIEQAKSRLDGKKRFFLRLDKEAYLTKDEYRLVEHGNCIRISMNIACFPNTDDNAINILKQIFA